MTELSDILKGAKDTIFKVVFKKKVDDKHVMEKLNQIKANDLKKADLIKSLSKGIIDGEQVTLIGHLLSCDQHMGRSLVIDLEAPIANRFRQVDHRTIQSIIFKNVKYNLNKKSALASADIKNHLATNKWDGSKLSVGNWFSEMQYYKVKEQKGNYFDCTVYNESMETYQIPDI